MSVYGKKIVIDGVEYVVVPKKIESTRNGLPILKRREINAKQEPGLSKLPLPNVTSEIYGQPYLNPLDMMLGNKTVLVDNKPCKIIDSRHECDYVSTKHIVTFEEMPCNLMPVIRCDADKFIVCLSEPDGLKPSSVPKQHYSEADAIKEAERLCKKHNQKFVILRVVAEVSPMICPVTKKRG